MLGVLQRAGTCPPRLRRCPPEWGVLARIWASRFASSALMNLIANLEAPERKTPTFKRPRNRPRFGGQRRASARRGGHVLALCKTPNKKPPETGGSAKRGGHVLALCKTFNKKPPETGGSAKRGGPVLALCKTVAISSIRFYWGEWRASELEDQALCLLEVDRARGDHPHDRSADLGRFGGVGLLLVGGLDVEARRFALEPSREIVEVA